MKKNISDSLLILILLITNILFVPLMLSNFSLYGTFAFATLILLIIGISFVLFSVRPFEDKFLLLRFFVWAFVIRVVITLLMYTIAVAINADSAFGVDSEMYDELGWAVAKSWRAGGEYHIPIYHTGRGYIYLIASLYYLVGHNTLIGRVFNCFFSALTVIYVYRITVNIYGKRTAKIAAFLVAFSPELIVWSGIQYKDILLAFLITFTIWHGILLRKKLSLLNIILILSAIFCIFQIRTQIAIYLIFLIGIYILIASLKRVKLQYIISIVVIVPLALLLISRLSSQRFERLEIFEHPSDVYNRRYEYKMSIVTLEESGLSAFLYKRDILSQPYILPFFFIYPMIIPIPFSISHWGFNKNVLLGPGAVIWYLLIPCAIYGFLYSVRNKLIESSMLTGIVTFVIMVIPIAYMIGNIRYKVQIIPINMIFAAIGIDRFNKWRKFYPLHLYILGALGALYMIFKFII